MSILLVQPPSRCLGFSWHSHTVMQCHPMAANRFWSSISRCLFLRILFTQNSLFVFGILQHSEFSMFNVSSLMFNDTPWPCQKHPFTKIHVRYFLSTRSGCPGSRLWFSLYLNPLFHNPRRTSYPSLGSPPYWCVAVVE